MNTLIERYSLAVGRHLPKKGREDVLAEINTLVEDMLADRYPDSDPTEEQLAAILEELGSPQKVAASYQPEKYLIGPRVYPLFLQVTKIVFAALSGALLLSFVLSTGVFQREEVELGQALLRFFPGLINGLFSAFASLVIVFTIIERTTPVEKLEIEWSVQDLPEVEGPQSFRPVLLTWEIAFSALIAVILNFFPQWLGIFSFSGGDWTFFPILSEDFFSLLPFLNIGVAADIARNVYILVQRGWNPVSEWVKLATDIYDIFLLFLIASTPILGLHPDHLAFHNISSTAVQSYEELLPVLSMAVHLGLWIAAIVITILTVIELIKRFTQPKPAAPPIDPQSIS